MPVIEVSHLTKEYRLGALQGLKQQLINTGARLIGRKVPERPLFKALDDVSFSIEQGEVVGIIGHNGAGKSTLLKMLAKISNPTSGHVCVDGRIAPLIEVGAGFVPDFTGRENVYLNGSILGMSKRDIDKKFEQIVDFAEMAEFIDTPVKRYSSGMQVKLAFAVATSIESEILIIDEVLAVGDISFQRKCFDRMESLIKNEGKTVLLVSHNIRQVSRLCSRALMISHGKLVADDSADKVCNIFYDQMNQQIHSHLLQSKKITKNVISTGEIELLNVTAGTPEIEDSITIETGSCLEIHLTYQVKSPTPPVIFGIGVHTTDMLYLATEQSISSLAPIPLKPGLHKLTYRIPKFQFLPGTYFLRLGIALERTYQAIFYCENAFCIHVQSESSLRAILSEKSEGFFPLGGEWKVQEHIGS